MKWWFYTILILVAAPVFAFYGDVATDEESITLGIAGQNSNQVTSVTALFPIPDVNGWTGIYVSRQVADGMVTSETLNGHIQGGLRIREVGIEGYASATRDKWRAIDLSIETGYFIRPGQYTWNDIVFSGGAGNYTERRDVDEDIGRGKDDTTVTFGWLAFISGKWRNVSGVVRFKPSIQFTETSIESGLALNHEISDRLAMGLSTQLIFDSDSITDQDFHTSYLLQFTYTPN